jgi:hypothetical protein
MGSSLVKLLLTSIVASIALVGFPQAAFGSCDGDATASSNYFGSEVTCETDAHHGTGVITATGGRPGTYINVHWSRECLLDNSGPTPCGTSECLPSEDYWMLFGMRNGRWDLLGKTCSLGAPDPVDVTAQPQVTPALVARAFQRIPLPRLRAVTQPADKTLVNFDTIFYVQAEPLRRTLTLLGQRVELAITPSTFRWVHGDGTTAVTHTPGAAYPAKDIVHRYQQAHVVVRQHVEIVWTARWRLNGGAFQDVPGTVTTVGPDTPLRIAEATPALSGYGH